MTVKLESVPLTELLLQPKLRKMRRISHVTLVVQVAENVNTQCICILPIGIRTGSDSGARHPRCVNQITNMADVQSRHNYIYIATK